MDESWIILVEFCEEGSENVDSVLAELSVFHWLFFGSDILILDLLAWVAPAAIRHVFWPNIMFNLPP